MSKGYKFDSVSPVVSALPDTYTTAKGKLKTITRLVVELHPGVHVYAIDWHGVVNAGDLVRVRGTGAGEVTDGILPVWGGGAQLVLSDEEVEAIRATRKAAKTAAKAERAALAAEPAADKPAKPAPAKPAKPARKAKPEQRELQLPLPTACTEDVPF